MGTIVIEGIRLYAYHGCLPEEGLIGANYTVDVTIKTAFEKAAQNDNLDDTIDYVDVYEIVKKQMAIRSKLIEHVGQRIIDQLNADFNTIEGVQVKVTKHNPPMNGNVDKVSVVLGNLE